ncbi:Ger(x)C family spore germination protein [Clostridium tagluense]|uniref:Ger(x)C family spore germination protein n=1 Tax=Clostridium tagluense TaxID=360422 RepID=UPI001C0B0DBD|nr:Ger(x)C family spore germination protein [Clostridium tagluense]MBU3129249.1 Ger(x)C family spore germination protein [Clostridium tagluense]MCB2310262.1 Ger(x)C family spore germination protein [Clostridium tagluense]MCB2315096.1 Ger(x)C family spore germination protein [Clostridium tagluense]MCB2319962.1 Ger(x)C family spore germination protein [Clostridium tagluense]MCB2324839.1 Ger(x)C family spore germination protein [Clostridium tagluense]
MNKKKYAIIIMGVLTYVFIMLGQGRVPIEEVAIINGIGYDIERKGKDTMEYSIPISTDIYKSSGTQVNLLFKDEGENLGEVIQQRQEKMDKKFVQGHEHVILISEEYARYGLKTMMEDRFRNAEANDMAYMAICKGKAEDYLKYQKKGYINASEYIGGLIETYGDYSFFSNNYKLIDAYVRIGAEGRNLVLPYIDITEEGIEITGLAIFNEDKMVELADVKNGRILNLLKNDAVKGIISLQKSPKQYIDFDAETSKKKVKCYRKGDKYSFIIDLSFTGTVSNNEMYVDMIKNINIQKEFEKEMAKSIESQCYDFIKRMQNDYKIDCIELGREAAAKYGRQKGIDWNEVVSNADIKVNVKVKVDLQGRGDY